MQRLDQAVGQGRASYGRPCTAQDRKQSLTSGDQATRINVVALCALDDLIRSSSRLIDVFGSQIELRKQTSDRMGCRYQPVNVESDPQLRVNLHHARTVDCDLARVRHVNRPIGVVPSLAPQPSADIAVMVVDNNSA
jgi:hypothetical protein